MHFWILRHKPSVTAQQVKPSCTSLKHQSPTLTALYEKSVYTILQTISSCMLIGLSPRQRVQSCDAGTSIPSATELWLVWVSDCPARAWLPPSHLSLSIHLSRTIMLDKSGIIHFGKWRRATLESPRCIWYMLYSTEWCLSRQTAAEKWEKKRQTLPEDCVATVGWMQQHQKEKAHTQSAYW